jgi:nucleotide-binding universal stress UspA family protein
MTYKSILMVASGEAEDAQVLTAAARLAGQSGGRVKVVPAYPVPGADLVYYGAALHKASSQLEAHEALKAAAQEAQSRLESVARDVASQSAVKVDIAVEGRALQPATALAPEAVLADLVFFGAAAVRSSAALGGLFAEALLQVGAPMLLIKQGAELSGPVAVAWDGSPQASRAVRAAMPMLVAAKGVLILRNSEDAETTPASDTERLRDYLALHGVAESAIRNVRGDNVANSLLDAARADECRVLVAGAYGRSRLYELVLGGTTRALVNAADGPHLLLAH